MNFRSVVAGAVRDIAQARMNTLASWSRLDSLDMLNMTDTSADIDAELRMTRGMVDDGAAADPLYRATGGVAL